MPYQTPQVDLGRAEQDAADQRNAQKVQQLKAQVEQGYRPTPQEAQLIMGYYQYDPKANTIQDYSWWHTWGPIVMAVAGTAAGGVLSGTGALSGLLPGAGTIPGMIDTAAGGLPAAAGPLAGLLTSTGQDNPTMPRSQEDPSDAGTTGNYPPDPDPTALKPGEGWPSMGKIGVPDSLSNAGLTPSPAAGGGLPGWVKPVTALAPLAVPAITRLRGGGSDPAGNGLDPTQSAQLNELMQLLIDRAKRTAPVHQLAMDTATRLAPRPNNSPQFQQALAASTTPRVQHDTDPQVLDAIHRLMSGGR